MKSPDKMSERELRLELAAARERIRQLEIELDEMALTAANYGWPLTSWCREEVERRLRAKKVAV